MATIRINNIDRVISKLNKIANVDMTDAVKNATTFVHGQAKILAPVDTDNLAGSIHMEVKSNTKQVVGRVYTNTQYAPCVEFGTGIKGNGTYPYKKIALTYRSTPWVYTPDDGETFYRTEGQVAKPYMYPALKSAEKYVKTLINKDLKNKIESICK